MDIKEIDDENMVEMQQVAANPDVIGLMKSHKINGYLTYEEINEVLTGPEYDSDKLDLIMTYFTENDVKIISIDDEAVIQKTKTAGIDDIHGSADNSAQAMDESRGGDPVKLYLREMGNINLLSREGEITIAMKIESFRTSLNARLCESRVTADMISSIRDRLDNSTILLRDVIASDMSMPEDEAHFREIDESDEVDLGLEECPASLMTNDEEMKRKLLVLFDRHLQFYSEIYDKQKAAGFDVCLLDNDNEYQTLRQKIVDNFYEINLNEKRLAALR
ncbi:MAG: hypothetical protein LBJ42_01340, partial [Holosporales bacterium]|nr:hypothetical protein [Holosporales bacterium]